MEGMHILLRLTKTRWFEFQDSARVKRRQRGMREPCTGGKVAGVSYKNQPPKPESHVESARCFRAPHPTMPKDAVERGDRDSGFAIQNSGLPRHEWVSRIPNSPNEARRPRAKENGRSGKQTHSN